MDKKKKTTPDRFRWEPGDVEITHAAQGGEEKKEARDQSALDWLMPGGSATETTMKHGNHNQATHGQRGGGEGDGETRYDFKRGQKVKNPYGKRETVMSADDAKVITYESARRNEWYHPSRVAAID